MSTASMLDLRHYIHVVGCWVPVAIVVLMALAEITRIWRRRELTLAHSSTIVLTAAALAVAGYFIVRYTTSEDFKPTYIGPPNYGPAVYRRT